MVDLYDQKKALREFERELEQTACTEVLHIVTDGYDYDEDFDTAIGMLLHLAEDATKWADKLRKRYHELEWKGLCEAAKDDLDADLVPCPHQDPDTWCCEYGIDKPEGMCKPHTFKCRHVPAHARRPYGVERSSLLCIIKKEEQQLSKEQMAILHHTAHRAANGMYCGDSPDIPLLVKAGLMESAGWKSFGPDEYFRITDKGREALRNANKKEGEEE